MIGIGSMGAGGPRGILRAMGGQEDGTVQGWVLLRLLRIMVPFWRRLVVAFLLMLITTGSGLLVPYLTRVIIDVNIHSGDLEGLLRNGLWLGLALLATYGAAAGQSYLLSTLGQRVLYRLRSQLFDHLQRLSVAYHDTHIVGVTVSRVMNDVSVINNLLSEGLVTLVGDSILLAGTVGIMIAMNVRLALITFTILPAMVVATVIFSRRAKVAFRDTREKVGALVGNLAENIGGMRVIQSYAREEKSQEQFEVNNRENRRSHVRAMSLSFVFLPTIDVFSVVAICIVLVAGGVLALKGDVTIGIIVAFMSYVGRFFVPIREMSQLFTTLQSASAGGERVLQLLDAEPAVADRESATDVEDIIGRVELRGVSFAYRPDIEVLHDVDLHAMPGETIAIVGPTGAGKSTITNLVCRFYETGSGAVLVDGVDVRDITAASLHRHMGYVSQDPILFPGTIAENIAYGYCRDGAGSTGADDTPAATQERIEAAARAAEAHTFIQDLPDGYDTRVYEGGANLSVGQRQLLSIARAMLVDPRILIMDEATSSVDTHTEELIQRALENLLTRRTAIVIAHRLTTVQHADRIYVLDDGRVVETGNHGELMQRDTMYRDLYRKQFVDETGAVSD
jgi:ABC-type multidrug transport system fused ATPase/permease subunit